jgi:hypothetical protein
MLKKRTYTEATAEPPALELPQAATALALELPQAAADTRDPVKKQKSVHFGAIQILGQTDKSALEARVAAFNHSVAQQNYQKGCLDFNRMVVAALSTHCTLPLWEECRKQLESLRLDAEAAIRHKLQMETKNLLHAYTMTL